MDCPTCFISLYSLHSANLVYDALRPNWMTTCESLQADAGSSALNVESDENDVTLEGCVVVTHRGKVTADRVMSEDVEVALPVGFRLVVSELDGGSQGASVAEEIEDHISIGFHCPALGV